MGKVKKFAQSQAGKTTGWIAGLLILGLGITAIVGWQQGWLGAGLTTTTEFDYWEVSLFDRYDTSEDNYEIDNQSASSWYRANIENLETEEIQDLVFSDFTLLEADDKTDMDEDYIYFVKIDHPGFVPVYYTTSVLLFEGKLPLLADGPNSIFLTNYSVDVSMLAYAKDSLASLIADTTEAKWIVKLQSLDGAEGTGEATSLEGFTPYFDPEANDYQRVMLRIEYNDTASTSYVNLMSNYVNEETANVNYSYIAIDAILIDDLEVEIKFASTALMDLRAIVGISIGYGTADDFNAWDTQV